MERSENQISLAKRLRSPELRYTASNDTGSAMQVNGLLSDFGENR
jgi:hypothetical protein